MPLLSFLNLIIYVLFLIVFVSVPKIYPFSFFKKTHLLFSLIFSISFLLSILFISSHTFILSFLVLALGLVCFSSSSLRYKIRFLVEAKTKFLCRNLLFNFPLKSDFSSVLLCCIFVLIHLQVFKFCLVISSLIYQLVKGVLLILTCSWIFLFCFCR